MKLGKQQTYFVQRAWIGSPHALRQGGTRASRNGGERKDRKTYSWNLDGSSRLKPPHHPPLANVYHRYSLHGLVADPSCSSELPTMANPHTCSPCIAIQVSTSVNSCPTRHTRRRKGCGIFEKAVQILTLRTDFFTAACVGYEQPISEVSMASGWSEDLYTITNFRLTMEIQSDNVKWRRRIA